MRACPLCKTIRDRFFKIIWLEPTATEVISSLGLIAFAIALLIGPAEAIIASYDVMFLVAEPAKWAAILVFFGTLQGCAVFSRFRYLRSLSAMCAAMGWLGVSGMVFAASP